MKINPWTSTRDRATLWLAGSICLLSLPALRRMLSLDWDPGSEPILPWFIALTAVEVLVNFRNSLVIKLVSTLLASVLTFGGMLFYYMTLPWPSGYREHYYENVVPNYLIHSALFITLSMIPAAIQFFAFPGRPYGESRTLQAAHISKP